MKREELLIMLLMMILIAGAVTFLIYRLAAGRNKRTEYQKQGKSTFVQNGVDVKKQTVGSGKGEYFTSNLEEYGTNYINGPVYSTWRISFRNLGSGEVCEYRFRRQMWIGRLASAGKDEIRLVLSGDLKVSKTHCVIYEGEGRLCLADHNSGNHTYLNGKRVESPVFLNNGDIIRAGDTRLKVEFGK